MNTYGLALRHVESWPSKTLTRSRIAQVLFCCAAVCVLSRPPANAVQPAEIEFRLAIEESSIPRGAPLSVRVSMRSLRVSTVSPWELGMPSFRDSLVEVAHVPDGEFQTFFRSRPDLYFGLGAGGGGAIWQPGEQRSTYWYFSTGAIGETAPASGGPSGPGLVSGSGLFQQPGEYAIRTWATVTDWPNGPPGETDAVFHWIETPPVSFVVYEPVGVDAAAFRYLQSHPAVWHLLNWDAAKEWPVPKLLDRVGWLEEFLWYFGDTVYAKYARVSLMSFYECTARAYWNEQSALADRYWAKLIRLGERALHDNPGYLPSFVHLPMAQAYAHLGKPDDARRHANAALNSEPATDTIASAQQLIASLPQTPSTGPN